MLAHDYGKVHKGGIRSITCSPDGESLFTSEYNGYLKQWHIISRRLTKNYGQQHQNCITAMCVTLDSKYLYTADEFGLIKQFTIFNQRCIKSYEKVLSGIQSMAINNEFLFAASDRGNLVQYDVNFPIEEDVEMVREEITQQNIAEVLALLKSGHYRSKNNFISNIPQGEEENYIKEHWDLFKSGAFRTAHKHIKDNPSPASESKIKSPDRKSADFDVLESKVIEGFFNTMHLKEMDKLDTIVEKKESFNTDATLSPQKNVDSPAIKENEEKNKLNQSATNEEQEQLSPNTKIAKQNLLGTVKNILMVDQSKIVDDQIKQLNKKYEKIDVLDRELLEVEMKMDKIETKINYLEKQDEKKESLGGFKEIYNKVNLLEQGLMNNQNLSAEKNLSNNVGNNVNLMINQNNIGILGDCRYSFKFKYNEEKESEFNLPKRVEK